DVRPRRHRAMWLCSATTCTHSPQQVQSTSGDYSRDHPGAAVDEERLAGHVLAQVTGKIQDGTRNVLGLGNSAPGYSGGAGGDLAKVADLRPDRDSATTQFRHAFGIPRIVWDCDRHPRPL